MAIAAEWFHAPPLAVFGLSALAILPLSALLGQATEELAARTGPTIGGLLNATLGNLAELIIAAFALQAGLMAESNWLEGAYLLVVYAMLAVTFYFF